MFHTSKLSPRGISPFHVKLLSSDKGRDQSSSSVVLEKMRFKVIVYIALLFAATCWWVHQKVPNLDVRDTGAMPENDKANTVTKEAKDEVIEGGAVADHGAREKARDTAEKEYEDAQQRSRDTYESAKKRMSGRDKTVFEAAKEAESHATGELGARMRDDVDVDEL